MNNSKKIITTIIGIILVVGIIIYFVRSEISKTGTQSPLPRPDLPVQIEGSLPLSLEITSKDFNFPSKLPALTVTPEEISLDKIKEMASKLDFTTEPDVFKDTKEGNKYYWTDGDVFFLVTPKTNTIKHGKSNLPRNVQNKQLNNDDYIKLATSFLTDKILIPEDKIKFSSIVYLDEDPRSDGYREVDESIALLTQVNLTYEVSNYEILTLDPSKPLIFIQFLKDGSIYNSEIISLGQVNQSEDTYKIKSFEEFENSIDKAILIHLKNDYVNISDLSLDLIQKIQIEKVSLVYLLDKPYSRTMQPVFLVEGPASVLKTTVNWAQLYLPAIK